MESKDRTVTVAVITGLIALLLGCCLGALAGAAGGYLIGHPTRYRSVEQIFPTLPATPQLPNLQGMQGAVVQEVIAGSPAEGAGVQVGDIITAVDGTTIGANHRLADIVSAYQPGDRIRLRIWRAGDTKTVTVTLGENPQDSTRPYLGVRYGDIPEQPDNTEPSN